RNLVIAREVEAVPRATQKLGIRRFPFAIFPVATRALRSVDRGALLRCSPAGGEPGAVGQHLEVYSGNRFSRRHIPEPELLGAFVAQVVVAGVDAARGACYHRSENKCPAAHHVFASNVTAPSRATRQPRMALKW